MKRILSGIALVALITSHAAATELITTANDATAAVPQPGGSVGAPPPLGVPPRQLASADDQPTAPAGAGCSAAAPDRKPHGVAWAGVGTHGYRDVGTAVTAPVGKCGSVSIAVGRTEGALDGWRR